MRKKKIKKPFRVNQFPPCDFRPDAHRVFIKRRRKNGEPYTLPVIVGTPCGAPAVMSYREEGSIKHRCPKHTSAQEAIEE